MSVEELDQQIRAAQERAAALKENLGTLREKIVDEYCRFAAEWVPEEAKKELVENHEVTNEHQAELAELKAEVAALSEKMPQLMAEELKDDRLWPHARGFTQEELNISRIQRPMRAFQDRTHKVVGALGELLVGRGLAKAGTEHDYHNFYWRRSSGGRGTTAHLSYARAVGWPTEAVAEYERGLEDLFMTERDLARLRRERDKAEVANLWDEA